MIIPLGGFEYQRGPVSLGFPPELDGGASGLGVSQRDRRTPSRSAQLMEIGERIRGLRRWVDEPAKGKISPDGDAVVGGVAGDGAEEKLATPSATEPREIVVTDGQNQLLLRSWLRATDVPVTFGEWGRRHESAPGTTHLVFENHPITVISPRSEAERRAERA